MNNIIILGSGRSGTSMMAGALANSGFHRGKNPDYLKRNKANPKGFFEDLEINTINEDILKKSVFNFPEKLRRRIFPSFTFYRARWLARIPVFVKIRSDQKINGRIQNVLSEKPFCFKDPRFSYTLPVWQNFFEKNTKFIVVFRNPDKTAQSIVRECKESIALHKLKMNKDIALDIWHYMYRHILKNYSSSFNKETWMFMHYEQLFDEKKVREIEKFVGAKIDYRFADKKVSRTTMTKGNLKQDVQEIYNRLKELAECENYE